MIYRNKDLKSEMNFDMLVGSTLTFQLIEDPNNDLHWSITDNNNDVMVTYFTSYGNGGELVRTFTIIATSECQTSLNITCMHGSFDVVGQYKVNLDIKFLQP